MKIFINDKELGSENYRYNVWVNGEKASLVKWENDKSLCIECIENATIKIEAENVIFKDKRAWLLLVLYWFLALITGSGEQWPLGKPFNAVIIIHNKGNKNIYLKVNSLKRKNAFTINGECEVLENYFYSPKGYMKKWFWGFAMPIALLIFCLSLLMLFMDFNEEFCFLKWIFVTIFLIAESIWIIYVTKIFNLK
ncbi:MAG: hypothetical protein IJA07_05135 [Agathobacter sp.]|nr:hypothetical protein [Agathobacter sp.]